MSLSRVPFEDAVKRLRISCLPPSVCRKLALYLDTHSDANWEFLSEVLGIAPLETQWVKDTVVNSRHGSPTLRLFERYLIPCDMSLEKFVQALEKIKNLACIRVLTEEYNNGVFDRAFQELKNGYNSVTQSFPSHHSDKCPSLNHHQSLPTTLPSAEYHQKLMCLPPKVISYDQVDGSFSSGSTYNSLEGMAGDTISYTHLDSYKSGGFGPEPGLPMNTGLCLGEYRLASLNDEQRFKELFTGNGTSFVNRMQDVALDLSKSYHVEVEPKVKGKHGCCCEARQNSCDKRPFKPCLHELQERNEGQCREFQCYELQRRQNVCAGHHQLCSRATPDQHKPPTHDIKIGGMVPVGNQKSPVKPEVKPENVGQTPRREKPEPDGAGKGSDICCFCLSRNPWNDSGRRNATQAAAICMRDPPPRSVPHHLSKRVTDPLSKEELESLEKEKQQTKNLDGTSPVRMTGSSYAVLQQKPFRKDSRSVRVFVTYSDDSGKHMKKVMQLCDCLKSNNFSVSIDVRENHLLSQDKMGWFDKRFKVADYVLVLISPKYYADVTEPDNGPDTQKNESTLNTLYIHRCMQAEYMMNNCLNKRFVPVLMPGATKEHVPCWLKNTTIYIWPEQYKNLFFYMMYPAQVISQFVRREQSAKTPTVITTNH